MSKFRKLKRYNKRDREELFIKLARAVGSIKNPVEGAEFLKDLLSQHEYIMLARRLQVAEMLLEGLTYEQIRDICGVGYSLIAKIQIWLDVYGEGYRKVIARTVRKATIQRVLTNSEPTSAWRYLKHRYPLHHWPELLLEEIIRSANKRQRKRLQSVLGKLEEKTKLSSRLIKLLQ